MRYWKGVTLGVLLGFSTHYVHAVSPLITNYQQLVKAVEQGDNVKAIVHFELCRNTSQQLQTEFAQNLAGATTRFNFVQYLHYNARIDGQLRNIVVTTLHSPVVDIYNQLAAVYGRLEVYDDNTALVRFDYFDADPIQQLFTIQWICDISNGRDDHGLYLYNNGPI